MPQTPILKIPFDGTVHRIPASLVAASSTTRRMMPLPVLMNDITGPGELAILITVKDDYAQLAHLMLASYRQRIEDRGNETTTHLLAEAITSLLETAAEESMMDIAFGFSTHDPERPAAQAAIAQISDHIHSIRTAKDMAEETP